MSDLVKYTEFNKYPQHMQKYLINKYSSKLLKDGDELKVRDAISDIITICINNGDNFVKLDMANEISMSTLRDNLYNYCIEEYPNLTYKELKYACIKGCNGDYEKTTKKLYGLCLSNIARWINCYLQSYTRLEAIKAYMQPEKSSVMPTKEMIEKGIELLKNSYVEPLKKIEREQRKKASIEFTRIVSLEPTQEQNWLSIFDSLHFLRGETLPNGVRYIKRYGKKLTVTDFMRYKANQKFKIETIKNHK